MYSGKDLSKVSKIYWNNFKSVYLKPYFTEYEQVSSHWVVLLMYYFSLRTIFQILIVGYILFPGGKNLIKFRKIKLEQRSNHTYSYVVLLLGAGFCQLNYHNLTELFVKLAQSQQRDIGAIYSNDDDPLIFLILVKHCLGTCITIKQIVSPHKMFCLTGYIYSLLLLVISYWFIFRKWDLMAWYSYMNVHSISIMFAITLSLVMVIAVHIVQWTNSCHTDRCTTLRKANVWTRHQTYGDES